MAKAATPQDSAVNGTLCEDASNILPNAGQYQQPDCTNKTTSRPDVDATHDQNFGQSRVDFQVTQLYEGLESMFHPDPYAGHKTVPVE